MDDPRPMPGEGTSAAHDGFQALFERSLNPMLIADDGRRLLDANRAAALLLRRPRADIVDRTIDDFVVPAQHDALRANWDQLIAEGSKEGTFRLRAPDGAQPDGDVRYAATANFRPGLHLAILSYPGDPEDRALPSTEASTMTQRERQVMTLVAMGLDGPQIAAELSIANPTVQTHVRNAMGRLGARTRAHAVALALTRGEIGF